MVGVLFLETLRREWRSALIWSVSIGMISLVQMLVLPDVDALEQFAAIIETLPPFILNALGGGDAAFIGTPEGYLAARFYSLALLFFSVYALNAGLNVTANEEDRKILDIVLSLPIPRWRLVSERLAAYALLILCMVLLTFSFVWLGLELTPVLEISTQRIFASTLNIAPGALLVLAFTTLVGALFRSRSVAAAAAASFVIGSFFIDFLGASVSDSLVSAARSLSFYAYYDSTTVMKEGLQAGNIALLLGATLLCVAGALFCFERRDIT